jgi:hypothetical protein
VGGDAELLPKLLIQDHQEVFVNLNSPSRQLPKDLNGLEMEAIVLYQLTLNSRLRMRELLQGFLRTIPVKYSA